MILHLSDWAKSPKAIADWNTKNDSFIQLAKLYKSMGVKNHAFMLALYQPELQGVDPHDPELTLEQKLLIGAEVRYNPWYYFREVVRVPPVAGPNPIPFKANRGNIALIWSFLNNIDFALIQPRQTGKSVSTDCLMIWLMYIACRNTLINMVTKDDNLRKKNVERLKKIRGLVPTYLIPLIKGVDSNNQVELTCETYKNSYNTGVAQNTESAANNLGRGLTAAINHFDESPFTNLIGVTLPAALASGNTAREEAERFNSPYGNIFTTTAGKKDDRDGRYMYDLISLGATWNEIFLDSGSKEMLLKIVKAACRGRKVIINGTFSHRQLGYTDQWLYDAIANANAKDEEADRDFFNIWTSGTQRSPLTVKVNETIRNSETDVKYVYISKEGFLINWYYSEEELARRMATGKFVLGMDTSDAVSRDAIAGVITAVDDLSVVGTFACNEANLVVFSNFIADIMIKYPNIILIPEKKSSAQTFIDALLLRLPLVGIDPFRRIFNSIVDDKANRQEEYKELLADMSRRNGVFYDVRKRFFGFNTDGAKRDLLYSTVLQNAAKKAGELVRDKALIGEVLSLVEKNSRIDHKSSGHDDMVISWLLTHWFLTYAKNLEFYGIDPSTIESKKHIQFKIMTPEEEFFAEQQMKYKEDLEATLEKLTEANSDFEIKKLEHRIKFLTNNIVQNDDNIFSIDALIQHANEQRESKRRTSALQTMKLDRDSIWGRKKTYGTYY